MICGGLLFAPLREEAVTRGKFGAMSLGTLPFKADRTQVYFKRGRYCAYNHLREHSDIFKATAHDSSHSVRMTSL